MASGTDFPRRPDLEALGFPRVWVDVRDPVTRAAFRGRVGVAPELERGERHRPGYLADVVEGLPPMAVVELPEGAVGRTPGLVPGVLSRVSVSVPLSAVSSA
jgi:hypothetical protein